jgi:predicted transcriptional regulator of viral defense system
MGGGMTGARVPSCRHIIVFGEQKEHTLAMPADTHTQRVLDLVHQKGLLRTSDLDAIEAPRVVLTRLASAGLLNKVGRGLYRLPSHACDGGGQSAASRVLPADSPPVP